MRPYIDLAVFGDAIGRELEDVAVFGDHGLLDDAEGLGEFGMAFEVAVVAMDGDEELRPDEIDHEAELILRAVAGDVDEAVGAIVVDDLGVAALEVIDDAADGALVAGDDAGAEEDGVAGVDAGELVGVDGGAGESAHGLALGAGDEDHELVCGEIAHLAGLDDEALRGLDVAEILGDFSGVIDGAADDGDLAAVLVGEIHGDADTVDGGREAGEEELLFRLREDVVERGDDGGFAGGIALAVDVGRVLQEGEDALVAELGEGLEIEGLAVGRGEVDLEVAGVDDDADGRGDGEGDAIDERVGDANRLDAERPDGEALAGKHLDEVGVVEEAMLFELAFDVGEGELRAVDGNFKGGEDPWQAADVILVAVREQDGSDLGAVLNEVADVGDDDIDAEQLFFREHEAGVDDEDVVSPFDRHAVHAELAETAQRDNA